MRWPWLLQWRVGGIPVRIHASTVLGALAAAAVLRTSDAVAAYAVLVAVHLCGHALLCWRYGMRVARIDLHAWGGDVSPQGRLRPGALAAIGVGGVFAQLLLGIALMIAAPLLGLDDTAGLLDALVQLNVLLGVLNFLPVPGSDGRFLWTLLREYAEQEEARRLKGEQRRWQKLIATDRARETLTPPRQAHVPQSRQRAARQELLAASLRAATVAELAERDARADAGIPEALSREVQDLLDGAFSAPE